MKKLKFDLTDEQGIRNSKALLEDQAKIQSATAGVVITVDLRHLLDFISSLYNRFLDIFDSSKKLEKQMEIVKETIKMSRELGAKFIEIVIDTKNSASLTAYLKKINANVKGAFENGNKMTYKIEFE